MNIHVRVDQDVGYPYFSEGVNAWVQFTEEIRQESTWHSK